MGKHTVAFRAAARSRPHVGTSDQMDTHEHSVRHGAAAARWLAWAALPSSTTSVLCRYLGPGPHRILDAAVGLGTQLLGLAAYGHALYGSDGVRRGSAERECAARGIAVLPTSVDCSGAAPAGLKAVRAFIRFRQSSDALSSARQDIGLAVRAF